MRGKPRVEFSNAKKLPNCAFGHSPNKLGERQKPPPIAESRLDIAGTYQKKLIWLVLGRLPSAPMPSSVSSSDGVTPGSPSISSAET